MSARDDLAQLLVKRAGDHIQMLDSGPEENAHSVSIGLSMNWAAIADIILAAGWRPPARIIATESDLTVADYGTVITDAEGRICEVDDSWLSGHICLDVIGQDEQMCGDELTWPATVLWEPEADDE